MESRDTSLANSMIELLIAARTLDNIHTEDFNDLDFTHHIHITFAEGFASLNSDLTFLTLFFHPLYRDFAISKIHLSRTFSDVVRISCSLAKKWKWGSAVATKLVENLQHYSQAIPPFTGGLPDGQDW
ncbi:hypothetical protein C8Q75DRAFT_811044 [Abortiporus biennis]|nr:hypothetical protein C8Q75DRAFT_811044 [Abortiporus biennis]